MNIQTELEYLSQHQESLKDVRRRERAKAKEEGMRLWEEQKKTREEEARTFILEVFLPRMREVAKNNRRAYYAHMTVYRSSTDTGVSIHWNGGEPQRNGYRRTQEELADIDYNLVRIASELASEYGVQSRVFGGPDPRVEFNVQFKKKKGM